MQPIRIVDGFGMVGAPEICAMRNAAAPRRGKERSAKVRRWPNGRCRMHGGPSTGAKTPEGKARCRMSNYKHGYYTYAAINERGEARRKVR